MASALYPKWKENLIQFTANNDLDNANLKVALIDTGTYTYNSAHDFYADLSGVVGTPVALTTSRTYTNGLFDAADVTFTSVSGNSVEALVIYVDTGNTATSPLIAYIDGFSAVTPNGGDITVAWNASGIFQL